MGMADTEPVLIETSDSNLPVGELNREYILKLKQKKIQELAHQKNRRTDFKVLSDDFQKWIKQNPDGPIKEKVVQNASITDDGEVVPMKKTSGSFLQQID